MVRAARRRARRRGSNVTGHEEGTVRYFVYNRDGRPGHIHVELHADGEVVLTVSDNGIGIRTQQPEGVGSRVLSLLSQQLGGTIDYENLDQGCRVTLRMPKPSV